MAKRAAPSQSNGNGKKAKLDASLAPPKKQAPAGILKKQGQLTKKQLEQQQQEKQKQQKDVSAGKGVKMAPSAGSKAKGKGRMVEDADETAAAAAAANNVTTPSLSEISKIQKQRSKEAVAFEVVAGSYERLLFGLHCTPSGGAVAAGLPPSGAASTAALGVHMEPIFQFPAHLSCVKTAAASANGKWLVTGAADEVIKVWDLRKRKEVGGLLGHEGACRWLFAAVSRRPRRQLMMNAVRARSDRRHHQLDVLRGQVPRIDQCGRHTVPVPDERLVCPAQIQRAQGTPAFNATAFPA